MSNDKKNTLIYNTADGKEYILSFSSLPLVSLKQSHKKIVLKNIEKPIV